MNAVTPNGPDFAGTPIESCPTPVFAALHPDDSEAYIAYLNHELEMQKLLLQCPSLHTLLALRNTLHVQRVTGYQPLDLEEAGRLFLQPPLLTQELNVPKD